MTEQFHLDELLCSAEMRAPKSALASVSLLSRAIKVLRAQIEALAPESAPPVPVTAPPTEPTTPSMTAAEFYAELDALEETAFNPRRMPLRVALTMAVDLGARWRAATGLPLPVRPR